MSLLERNGNGLTIKDIEREKERMKIQIAKMERILEKINERKTQHN